MLNVLFYFNFICSGFISYASIRYYNLDDDGWEDEVSCDALNFFANG